MTLQQARDCIAKKQVHRLLFFSSHNKATTIAKIVKLTNYLTLTLLSIKLYRNNENKWVRQRERERERETKKNSKIKICQITFILLRK